MKNLIYLSVFLVIISSFTNCKPKPGFGKDKTISGTVYVKDSISPKNISVSNATVFIGFDHMPTETDYNYKTVTNASGEYLFQYLFEKEKKDYLTYHLFVTYKDPITKQEYEDSISITSTGHDFTLRLKDPKKTITGTVVLHDSLTGTLKSLANADVYFGYKDLVPNSSNYTYKTLTNTNGKFTSPQLDTNTIKHYNVFIQKTINIGGNSVLFSKYVPKGQSLNAIELLPIDSIGYLSVKLVNANSTPQPGFTTCFYSNRTAFSNTILCSGSFYSSVSNQKGLTYISGLNPNSKYYLKSYKILANDTIIVKDSLTYSKVFYPIHTTTLN